MLLLLQSERLRLLQPLRADGLALSAAHPRRKFGLAALATLSAALAGVIVVGVGGPLIWITDPADGLGPVSWTLSAAATLLRGVVVPLFALLSLVGLRLCARKLAFATTLWGGVELDDEGVLDVVNGGF